MDKTKITVEFTCPEGMATHFMDALREFTMLILQEDQIKTEVISIKSGE